MPSWRRRKKWIITNGFQVNSPPFPIVGLWQGHQHQQEHPLLLLLLPLLLLLLLPRHNLWLPQQMWHQKPAKVKDTLSLKCDGK